MTPQKGAKLHSVDGMLAQDWIFFREKLYRPMWLSHFALEFILEALRRGEICEALVEDRRTGELEGQLNLYQMDDGRPMTPAEIKRDRRNNR